MADQVDHKGGARCSVHPFVRKQVPNIEKIPRMLGVNGCNDFSDVLIAKRDDKFSESKHRFDCWRHGSQLRPVNATAQDCRNSKRVPADHR